MITSSRFHLAMFDGETMDGVDPPNSLAEDDPRKSSQSSQAGSTVSAPSHSESERHHREFAVMA